VKAVLDIIVPLLAGLTILAALLFALRGWRHRARSSTASYGVAQQEAKQAMQIDFVRSVAAVFVGLILLAVAGMNPSPSEAVDDFEFPPATQLPASAAPSATPIPSSTAPALSPTEGSVEAIEPTSTTPIPTNTPEATPTATPVPEPATATVVSEAGVWLRSSFSTESEQLEWVLEGEKLVLLPGLESSEDFDWQRVRTEQGNEGWVAVAFIEYNQ
jgi:hypothetical protein